MDSALTMIQSYFLSPKSALVLTNLLLWQIVSTVQHILQALVDNERAKVGRFALVEDERRHGHVLTPNGIVQKGTIMQQFLAQNFEEYEVLKSMH